MPLSDATPRWALLAAILWLSACTGTTAPKPQAAPRVPTFRAIGARLPAFSGNDPTARGWVKVDDLIWVDGFHAEQVRQGYVFDGTRYIPADASLPAGIAPTDGYLMRTDHVAVLTNLSWSRALEVARVAENHVARFFATYGDALDIRLPDGPLTVVVTARRSELMALLRDRMPPHVSWAAFYDATEGTVYVSTEPAPAGELPWVADLRHEMTHQILDLARSAVRRGQPFPRGWFWLWEGIAIHSENLGGASGGAGEDPRWSRFRKRLAWNQVTPLPELTRLGPAGFEGRHYDQTGMLMRYLLDGGRPSLRSGTLGLVRDLLRSRLDPRDLPARLGQDLVSVERDWLATLDR